MLIKPDYEAESLNNIGIVLRQQNKIDHAIRFFKKALSINSSLHQAHNNLIFCQDFMPNISLIDQQKEREKWNHNFILPLSSKCRPHTNERNPDKKLSIGYVSSDFKKHSAAIGFSDLILNYDSTRFQVYCYCGVERFKSDEITALFQNHNSIWRSVHRLKDIELVEQIRKDQIDILVDLSGHTAGNRLLTFGYKPAPIQVTGIGHAPPGLTTIDYRLTSKLQTFFHEEILFPEQPIYLSYTMGFHLHQTEVDLSPLPSYKNGFLTFGYLNRWDKISPEILSIWIELMRTIPDSRLILKGGKMTDKNIGVSILSQMKKGGISEERIDLRGQTSHHKHLSTYQEIDIALDPFPYSGGITTLESFWMGIPVISLYEESKFASRNANVFFHPMGLGDWLAKSRSEYIQLAKDWSQKLEELEKLRFSLRKRLETQTKIFRIQVEEAYRQIWQRWCRNEKPSSLSINSK